jgi:hypothetical protein
MPSPNCTTCTDSTELLEPLGRGCMSNALCVAENGLKVDNVDATKCVCEFPDMKFDVTNQKCVSDNEGCLPDIMIDHCLFADEYDTCNPRAECKKEMYCNEKFDCTEALFSGKLSQTCNACHRGEVRDPSSNECMSQEMCRLWGGKREVTNDSNGRFREFTCNYQDCESLSAYHFSSNDPSLNGCKVVATTTILTGCSRYDEDNTKCTKCEDPTKIIKDTSGTITCEDFATECPEPSACTPATFDCAADCVVPSDFTDAGWSTLLVASRTETDYSTPVVDICDVSCIESRQIGNMTFCQKCDLKSTLNFETRQCEPCSQEHEGVQRYCDECSVDSFIGRGPAQEPVCNVEYKCDTCITGYIPIFDVSPTWSSGCIALSDCGDSRGLAPNDTDDKCACSVDGARYDY